MDFVEVSGNNRLTSKDKHKLVFVLSEVMLEHPESLMQI